MKILIVRSFPTYMDVKNNTYNIQEVGLARALVRAGNICDILFWTDKEEEDVVLPLGDASVTVFYRHGKSFLKNVVYKQCAELFEKYDIIQTNEYNQYQSVDLARRYPEKTVIYHGPYYSPFNKRYNLMCKLFDFLHLKKYKKLGTRFITKSEMAREFLLSKGITDENVTSVGVGIDAQMLNGNGEECSEPLYKEIKEDSSEIKLLYIGRLEERRNIPFIFDILKCVKEKNQSVKLYMIGSGDKKYVESVFEYSNKLGVREDIVWQEKMQQKFLSRIYENADFFLLPTEYEIFGMVLLEAMYYGNIVLTTRNGGSSSLIENAENGFVIEEKNADVWSKAIMQVHANSEKRTQISEKARRTVEENFTWDALADKFIKVYKNK